MDKPETLETLDTEYEDKQMKKIPHRKLNRQILVTINSTT